MDKLHIFYEAINNHYLLSELDGADLLQEYNEIETNKVKQLIDTNSNWIVNDYPRFFNALKKTTRPEFFTPHTVQEFKDLGVTTYLLNGYNIGYALMPEPDGNVSIISIFNNEKEVKGVVDNILQSAVIHCRFAVCINRMRFKRRCGVLEIHDGGYYRQGGGNP